MNGHVNLQASQAKRRRRHAHDRDNRRPGIASTTVTAEGWHPDPRRTNRYRWWDGERWTERVVTRRGLEGVDPHPLIGRFEPPFAALPEATQRRRSRRTTITVYVILAPFVLLTLLFLAAMILT
jgi:hypothetical protein